MPDSSCSTPGAAARCCTTKLENAHGTEFREVLYPWHPWFGVQVGVHESIDKSDIIVFRCSLSGSGTDRWLEVPAWMFDRSACARMREGDDAHTDLAALGALAALLRQVLSGRLASSNAPHLSASILSRDQNRGEVHVTPDEVTADARPRAAANRPVRRTTAGDQRHADLVRAADADASSADRTDDAIDLGSCRQKPDRVEGGGRS